MNDSPKVVDLSKLGGKVFVGRPFGKKAREFYGLDRLDLEKTKIKIIAPENTISINSSFFLGLLSKDLLKIADLELFFEQVDISDLKDIFQEQIRTAASRSLFSKDIQPKR